MADVPSVPKMIQVEETDFRAPTSESMIQKIAGSLNYILDNMDYFAPGSVLPSKMTLAQFQAVMGVGWVLADGAVSPPSSKYFLITGFANIPDLRGLFARGYNNGKNTGYFDPDGRTLGPGLTGSTQDDKLAFHGHIINWNNTINSFFASLRTSVGDGAYPHTIMDGGSEHPSSEPTEYPHPPVLGSSGGAETRPPYITLNWFVRIN